jgi:hypothetical protein
MQRSDGSASIQQPPIVEAVTDHDHDAHAEHIHLPPPSIWPMTTAAGVTLGGLGLVTHWAFSAAGLIIMFLGIAYWIQELRHEHS